MTFYQRMYLILFLAISTPLPAAVYQSNGYSFEVEPTPQWVEPIAVKNQNPAVDGPVTYIQVNRQVNLRLPEQVEYRHQLERANSFEGVDQISDLSVTFNPDYETLTWHQVNILRDGQIIDRLNTKDISLIREESEWDQKLFGGYVTAMLFVKDVRAGDTLEYSYSIRGSNPVFAQHYFRTLSMSWQVPVQQLDTRILSTAQQPLYITPVHFDEKPMISQNKNGQVEYRWHKENTNTYYYEDDYPVDYFPGAYISVTDFPSWKAVIDWADPLYQVEEIRSSELLAQIETLKALPTEKAIAQALHFVQNQIRYLGIETGENSHLPRQPDEVIANRYGDCKDKTLMLIGLLKAIGVEAYPALVSWQQGRGVEQLAPSPGAFDHVITLVEWHGQKYWLDPTRTHQAGDLKTLGYHDYGKALVIGHDQISDLTDVGLSGAAYPSIEIQEEFRVIHYMAPVEHQIRTLYTGTEADRMRRRFASKRMSLINQEMRQYMQKLYEGLEQVTPLHVEDDLEQNRLWVTEHYRIRNFYSWQENQLVANFYAYGLYGYTPKPAVLDRQGPVALYGPLKITHQQKLIYPHTMNFNTNANQLAQSDDNVSLNFQEDYLDRTLTLNHEITLKRDQLPVSQLKSYLTLSDQLSDIAAHQYTVTLDNKDELDKALPALVTSLQSLVYELGEDTHE